MKTKAEAKVEAARLTIDSEAKNFTEMAQEIYSFLIEGINLPDTEAVMDPSILVNRYFGNMSAETKKDEDDKK